MRQKKEKSLSTKIRRLLSDAGWSFEDIGAACGCSRPSVYHHIMDKEEFWKPGLFIKSEKAECIWNAICNILKMSEEELRKENAEK